MDYYIILIGLIIIPVIAQLYFKNKYNKYIKINNKKNLSGFEIARKILDENGLKDVHIIETSGELSDHYDPKRKVIRLSNSIFNGTSICSGAVAAHEASHAIQDKNGYIFLKIRSLIFPLVNFTSKIAYYIIIIGLIAELSDLINLGIIFISFGILFQIITLPVEYNASSIAKEKIKRYNLFSSAELEGVGSMLNAAALTYLADVVSSILNLLRLLLISNRRRN